MMSVPFHMANHRSGCLQNRDDLLGISWSHFIPLHLEYRAFLDIFLYSINISLSLCCLYAIFLLVETS
jgi:hypothetical protein